LNTFVFLEDVTILWQGWANSGPRAECGLPQRFQWPGEAFRNMFISENSSNSVT